MNQGPENPISRRVVELRKSNRPIDLWTARSLEEIYLLGDLSESLLEGESYVSSYTPLAVRIVGLHEDSIIGVSVVLPQRQAQVLADELRTRVQALPQTPPIDDIFANSVASALVNGQRQVGATLEIARSFGDNKRFARIMYPNTLIRLASGMAGNIGIRLGDTQVREIAFGFAVRLLKAVPFSASESRINRPEA